MTRSKRKAQSQKQDFIKKKVKLGKKARAENFTDTTVKQRQIFVPSQAKPHLNSYDTARPLTGLLLSELISRTRHHNANTRTNAHNAICNALVEPTAVAHAPANASPAAVIAASAVGLGDEVALVRAAAKNLLLAVLRLVKDARPFQNLIATHMLACLSHIRTDVRLDAAKCLISVLDFRSLSPSDLFHNSGNPVDALCDLLAAVSKPRARTVALDAISALCETRSHGEAVDGSARRLRNAETRRFFYHSTQGYSERAEKAEDGLIERLSDGAISVLLTRTANICTECLPLFEARRDGAKSHLLTASARTLAALCRSNGSLACSSVAVQKTLSLWTKDESKEGLQEAQHFLARVGLSMGLYEVTAKYLTVAVRARTYMEGLSETTALFLERCDSGHSGEVAEAWCERFVKAVSRGDGNFVSECMRILSCIVRGGKAEYSASRWKVLRSMGTGLRACVSTREGGGKEDVFRRCETELAREFRVACAELMASKKDAAKMEMTGRKFVHVMCEERTAGKVDIGVIDELVGVAVLCGVVVCDEVVRFIGWCTRNERFEVAERFIAGIEWEAMGNDENRLKANALVRALRGSLSEDRAKVVIKEVARVACPA